MPFFGSSALPGNMIAPKSAPRNGYNAIRALISKEIKALIWSYAVDLIAAYSNTYDLVKSLRARVAGLPPTPRGGLTYDQLSKQDQQ